MKTGTFYGIGVGPGDPGLVTVKAATVLAHCRNVFVPTARISAESTALEIARPHLGKEARIHEMVFPMTTNKAVLAKSWKESAERIAPVLEAGEDACFLTLGDALLYSTYIYLLRMLQRRLPALEAVTLPGITSFSAAAALTNFPIGEGKEPVTIVPVSDDLSMVRRAIDFGGTVVLMKIASRLPSILDLLEERGLTGRAILVARAGQKEQRIETDLRKLRGEGADSKIGYLSVILVHTQKEAAS